jgi:CubicO group peptidase (beta-lactamase class C family)
MSTKTPFFALLALTCFPQTLGGQTSTATEKPRIESGFASDRLARIDQMVQRYVDENRIAGAVGLIMRDGKIVYERAWGWADKESGRRMTTDAIFRIASQSKAVTSTAIMILNEEGKLALGDPVSRYIPSFARTLVATPSGIVPAKRAITIHDLLMHTAGISYGTDSIVAPQYRAKGLGPAAGQGWYTADKNEPICTTMERLGSLPFVAQPGEKWVYGYNTDVLGCVVERASGLPLDQFIRTRITDPLGMKDTFFFLPLEKRQRFTAVYTADSTGRVHRAQNGPLGQGNYVDGPRMSFSGGAGLLSTARDYSRFLQMLLNGGELDGVRILSPKTVDVMTSNQAGNLFNFTPGMGFGLAFYTVDRTGADGLASVGSWGWSGAYSTMYKVDPKERLVIAFMVQQIASRAEVQSRFPTLVYQALVEPRK